MTPVFDRHEWPGPDIIGRKGVDACIYLIGNAAISGSLQLRASELMRKALSDGGLYGYSYASISDRVLALSGRPTVFGVSPGFNEDGMLEFSRDVIDPGNLDKRRAIVGLEPYSVQLENYLEDARKNGWDLFPDRDEWEWYKTKLAIDGGYI